MNQIVNLISSNAIAREGLSRIIESEGFEIAQAVGSVEEVDWSDCAPDHLNLLDITDRHDQINAVSYITSSVPGACCIVLSDNFNFEVMMECFNSGASGYITKDMPCSPLITSLRLAAMGQKIIPPHVIDVLSRQGPAFAESPNTEQDLQSANLSQREIDVLCCLMAGYPNKIIARQLEVTEATVKVHVKAILRKLNVGNRTQAAMWASSHGVSHDVVEARLN
jgi:two-component system nitrate/nitrite response regulator NarL